MAQIQVSTHSTQVSPRPQGSPHVMQRLVGMGCPGSYVSPREGQAEAALGLEEQLGNPDHLMHDLSFKSPRESLSFAKELFKLVCVRVSQKAF